MNMTNLVAYFARVSNPTNQSNELTSDKLIRYLIDNKHWSPFEMINICIEIETTRDIARQILRHRSFSFQEFSQRYAKADLGFECREARMQDEKNRQNSIDISDSDLKDEWKTRQKEVIDRSIKAYTWALDHGIAKEQARSVLPEGMTMSRMYVNGTLRSWMHYIQIRSDPSTQKEHREVAVECANCIKPLFPLIENFISL
jgi:thymidylate synthase (FAD)